MQLFITPFVQKENTIILTEERVVQQLKKVLRAKVGDQIAVQRDGKRVVCSISSIGKMEIITDALYEEENSDTDMSTYVAIALPNKFEKAELIVQKCSEMGIHHIVFFASKHSVLKEISSSKKERLEKISLEAVEQSRGKNIPTIIFSENIFALCEGKKVFVAHQRGEKIENMLEGKRGVQNVNPRIILVGPEGGRHADEEKTLDEMNCIKISFGETILRTETAAIIGGRSLKNFL